MSYILLTDFGGKDRGFKFNMGAVDVFWEKLNLSETSAAYIYVCFYCGLIGNCIVKGEQADFDLEKVSEWVDDLHTKEGGKEKIEEVVKCFAETDQYKNRLAVINKNLEAIVEPETTVKKKKK